MNRPLTRTYSNGDPSVTMAYDQPTCFLIWTVCHNVGHRTSMTDAAGSEAWGYIVDTANQRNVLIDKRTTNGVTKTGSYYSNFAGNLVQLNYPTGTYIYNPVDTAGRVAEVYNDAAAYAYNSVPPPAGCLYGLICYTPQGTVYSMSLNHAGSFNGLNIVETYNNRLQPLELKASSTGGNAFDLSYNYVDPVNGGNAGHVFQITNNLDTTRSENFTYDQLSRIVSAQTASTNSTSHAHCWGETYQYDGVANGAWGNLTQIAPTTNSAYTGCSQESGFSKTVDANNHLSGFTYDASGNTTNDGTYTYPWDAESELKSAGGVNYLYDGDGKRVEKVGSEIYWYGPSGEILGLSDMAGNVTHQYYYFNGRRIIDLAGTTTTIYAEDLLGTSRVVTNATGVVCYDADFYPFGGERAYTNTCGPTFKFEGKERDAETGNDDFGARYYSNRFGRWLSADWSAVPAPVPYANLSNPQTLNLYSMVADDPESFADLDGHGGCSGANAPVCKAILDAMASGMNSIDALQAAASWMKQNFTPGTQNQNGQQGQQGLHHQKLKYKTVSGGQHSNPWEIKWSLTHNTKKGGWIVQHFVADFEGSTQCGGHGQCNYWEAWPVAPNSHTPSIQGVDPNGDSYSDRFVGGPGSHAHASARFYEGLTLPDSFTVHPEGFPAGILRATTTDPNLPTDNATAPNVRWWQAP